MILPRRRSQVLVNGVAGEVNVPDSALVLGGVGQAIAINPDGSLAAPDGSIPGIRTHPARGGDYLMVFATGLGANTRSVADGVAAGNLIRNAKVTPMVLIGGVPGQVLFAGMSPAFVGVNQLNVLVPTVVGDAVPLQIDTGGLRTTGKIVSSSQSVRALTLLRRSSSTS